MNITLLINNPVFWVTIVIVVFFPSLAILALRNTKPRSLSKKEKLGITLILSGEIIAIIFAIFFIWSISKDEILWSFQSHDNLSTTAGEVIESKTEWSGSPSHNAFGLHFRIWYEYKVGETVYRSNRVNYAYTGSSDESLAESYVKKYPVGTVVTVYYDPLDPKKSVLEPDVIAYDGVLVLIMTIAMCSIVIPGTLVKFVRTSA